MVALIVLMAASMIITLSIDKHILADIHTSVEKQRALAEVELHYTKLLLAENSYALTGSPEYKEHYNLEKQGVEDALNTLKGFPLTVPEENEVHRFQTGLTEISQEMAVLFEKNFSDANRKIQEAVVRLDNSTALELADEIADLTFMIEAEVDRSIEQIEAVDEREFWFTIIPVLIIIPIALAVVYITITRISKPPLLLVQMAEKITMRDFSTRMRTGSLDEIGMLTRAFNAMAEEIERRYDELESFA